LVVPKPVNANTGLNVNPGNNFSSIKMISIAYVLCSLRILLLKTERQKNKQNTLLKSYKHEINILANPRLAPSGSKQLGSDGKQWNLSLVLIKETLFCAKLHHVASVGGHSRKS